MTTITCWLVPQADRLIERLAVSDIVGVHMVVITRYNGKLNSEELGLKGYLHSIVKEEFELKPRDIAEYYKTCGINVNDAEIGRLYALTEGWISALYLFMLEYIATGSYSPETNLYSLVEKTVYEPLASEKKDFLLTLSLFDNFYPRTGRIPLGRRKCRRAAGRNHKPKCVCELQSSQ